MTDTNKIRHRPDGSIDTGFYMDRARRVRSQHAHDMFGKSKPSARKAPTLLQRIFG